jgi:hypothetical protein
MLQMLVEIHVGPHVQCLLLWSDFNQNWNILTEFSKVSKSKDIPITGHGGP